MNTRHHDRPGRHHHLGTTTADAHHHAWKQSMYIYQRLGSTQMTAIEQSIEYIGSHNSRVTCGSVVQRPLASGPPQARLLTAQDVAISESMKCRSNNIKKMASTFLNLVYQKTAVIARTF